MFSSILSLCGCDLYLGVGNIAGEALLLSTRDLVPVAKIDLREAGAVTQSLNIGYRARAETPRSSRPSSARGSPLLGAVMPTRGVPLSARAAGSFSSGVYCRTSFPHLAFLPSKKALFACPGEKNVLHRYSVRDQKLIFDETIVLSFTSALPSTVAVVSDSSILSTLIPGSLRHPPIEGRAAVLIGDARGGLYGLEALTLSHTWETFCRGS